ncbi:hypothetical protein [Mesorhizobium delmotii]|uniref:Uncharacterized protein n=1 Tax=Mesorhizobium delmotii TaxID=1631247 RepID=A0A2P9APC1_9HYPH|nr:hypothetical protein [Mesorhizobium delmotii]SJM33008.1 hypothetical protein BQ8482_330143 [Mesorhizobium delmotii]
MSADPLHDRLSRLVTKTAGAEAIGPGGWWVGDVAGERQVLDDLAGGRLHWRQAHSAALSGLDALKSGDHDLADAWAWTATDLYVAALEAFLHRVRPKEKPLLTRPAGRRGRPRKKIKD